MAQGEESAQQNKEENVTKKVYKMSQGEECSTRLRQKPNNIIKK